MHYNTNIYLQPDLIYYASVVIPDPYTTYICVYTRISITIHNISYILWKIFAILTNFIFSLCHIFYMKLLCKDS